MKCRLLFFNNYEATLYSTNANRNVDVIWRLHQAKYQQVNGVKQEADYARSDEGTHTTYTRCVNTSTRMFARRKVTVGKTHTRTVRMEILMFSVYKGNRYAKRLHRGCVAKCNKLV